MKTNRLLLWFCLFLFCPLCGQSAEKAPSGKVSPDIETLLKAVWNDPAFSKDFMGSYGIHPEVEPKLPESQVPTMQTVQKMMGQDMKATAAELESVITPDMSAMFDFVLGNIYFQEGQLDKAAKWFQSAVDKFPKFRRAHKNLGLAYAKKGDLAKSIKPLTRYIELGGNDAITYGLLGTALMAQEDYVSAETAFRSALMFSPHAVDYKVALIKCLFQQKKFAEVASLTQGLIEASPDRPDFWLLQANAYLGQNLPAKAAENLEILDRLGKAPADALFLLGDIYANQGSLSLAANAYVRAIRTPGETNSKNVLQRAKKILAQGGNDPTREVLAALREKNGFDKLDAEHKKELLKLESRIALSEGAGEEAAKVLENIVQMDPLDGDALMLLGQHCGRSGEVEKACFYYERAAQIPAFEADAKTRHAQLLVGQSRLEEAIPLLRRAQELKPRESVGEYMVKVERMAKAKR
jgi:tetratricopeptide (TPR) repeat protein